MGAAAVNRGVETHGSALLVIKGNVAGILWGCKGENPVRRKHRFRAAKALHAARDSDTPQPLFRKEVTFI
ncbi:hypothetical protein thalar_02685 [Litoreibacter arenae DSM 19593]|uniref:Uncharacterized protein n=1 Tax=Litoreibacter arenae DSM 19593 TaxID=1123360 RepID=S9Q6F8_9RHOB|nr:hypothetical protein thalar_02685 [Litoreibacter arenae DSM 19593]